MGIIFNELNSQHSPYKYILMFLPKLEKITFRFPDKDPIIFEVTVDEASDSIFRLGGVRWYIQQAQCDMTGVYEKARDFVGKGYAPMVTVALPLDRDVQDQLRKNGLLYAFLPMEVRPGLPFLINSDFVLAASRERMNLNSPWNSKLFDRVPELFVTAFLELAKTLTRDEEEEEGDKDDEENKGEGDEEDEENKGEGDGDDEEKKESDKDDEENEGESDETDSEGRDDNEREEDDQDTEGPEDWLFELLLSNANEEAFRKISGSILDKLSKAPIIPTVRGTLVMPRGCCRATDLERRLLEEDTIRAPYPANNNFPTLMADWVDKKATAILQSLKVQNDINHWWPVLLTNLAWVRQHYDDDEWWEDLFKLPGLLGSTKRFLSEEEFKRIIPLEGEPNFADSTVTIYQK